MPETATAQSIRDVPLCIAVDKSGSTWGKTLMEEIRSVFEICSLRSSSSDSPVLVLPWCDTVEDPISLPSHTQALQQVRSGGGTNPGVLYSSQLCVKALKECGLWFLLTDGQIEDRLIQNFALSTADLRLHGKPCVVVIFGHASRGRPADCNISVGISLYAVAPDCLFLFHDVPTGKLSILQAKGCFRALVPGLHEVSNRLHLDEYTTWAELPHITYHDLRHVSVGPPRDIGAEDIALQNGLVVNMRDLYSADMNDDYVSQLFQNEDNLKSVMLAEMTRGREGEWMSWLDKLEQPVPKLSRERPDLGERAQKTIVQLLEALKIGETEPKKIEGLRASLRRAHEANLANFNGGAVAKHKEQVSGVSRMNGRVKGSKVSSKQTERRYRSKKASCMYSEESQDFSDDIRSLEPLIRPLFLPGFNRSAFGTEFCGKCTLCHRSAVLTVLLKSPPNTVTSNFPRRGTYSPLAFPMAMSNFAETDILSYSICCDSCALHLAQNYSSLHGETVVGALPLVSAAENKDAFLDALDKAFKGRFQLTDLLPLFIAVLDRKITENVTRDTTADERLLYTQALVWMKKSVADVAEVPSTLSHSFGRSRDRIRSRTLSVIISERLSLDPSDPDNEDVSILRYPVPGSMVLIRLLQEQGIGQEKTQVYLFQRFMFHVTEAFFAMNDEHGRQAAESVARIVDACSAREPIRRVLFEGDSPWTAIPIDQLFAHSLLDQDTLASFRTMAEFEDVEKRMGPAAIVYFHGVAKLGASFSTAVDCFNGLKAHSVMRNAILKPLAVSPGLCVDIMRELDRLGMQA